VTRPQIVLDCETTSLTQDYVGGTGTIWELATIDRGTGERRMWRMKPDLAKASPQALEKGGFYRRTADMCSTCTRPSSAYDLTNRLGSDDPHWSAPEAVAAFVAQMLDGATLIIAVPTFDAPYLSAFLAAYGQSRQPWHFRARDIGSMAWAYLQACHRLGVEGRDAALGCPELDASTDDFALALGLDLGKYERHSALGDCELVADMLDVIEGVSR
jgi:hypothetical protein